MTNPDDGCILENAGHGTEINESRSKPKKTSLFRWTLGLIVRLCIWYALLTPIFRCPSHLSDLNESSPQVCKPYLVARSYIEPYVAPYYETYGAPYVEITRPYARGFNDKVYTPVSNAAKWSYGRYGAPALDRTQQYTRQHWERQVVPHLQSAQDTAGELYKSNIAPHVERVEAALSPYCLKTKAVLSSVLHGYVLPFCAQSKPFIGKTYTSGQDILTTTVMPYAQTTWSSVIYFANSSLWPKITGLYSENVEPQLVKIRQRLASYREGRKLQNVVDDAESITSSEQPPPMTSASIQNEPPATSTAVESSPTPHRLSPTELAAQAREKIDSDLRIWQEKFTVAADKGIEDLEERINTIVESYISGGAKGRGESLLVSLDEVLEHELAQIKLRINALVESLPAEDAPQEEATAHDELLTEIRQAAIIVRDHAHALREWHETFDQEIERRVSAAVDSTLDVLNSVRDLGLQEIGMRWAWMDGVTYKDWADYHALKAGFNDWRGHIRDVGMQHAKIDEARALSDNILSHGMDGAKAAANELARLKDVGNWKIAAREVSDDFNARTSPPPPLPKCSTAISHTPGNDAEGQDEQDTPVSRGGEHDTDTNSASGSAIDDSETEEHGRGLDDAPLMDDQEHESLRHDEEMRKQDLQSINSSPSFSSEDEGENSATSEQEDAGENNGDRSAWGVAAADVDIEDNNSEDGQSSEVLHDILGAAGDNVAAATKTFDEDLLQPSSSPDLGERSTIEQDSDPQDTSDQPLPHYAAVEDLVALLLEGRESSFAEDVMNKLHAIYGQSISAAPSPTDDVEHAQDTRDSSPVSTTGVPILDNNVEGASEQTQLGINGDPDDETEYLEVSGEASSCIAAENDDLADHVEDTLNRGEL